ncbi:MAG: iron-sulfur cluster assembly scaffold protein [Dehalococcoidia bacterium]|nr:iron-sulfur cluster assembly scaffold protein [Dehalococcoidia bacterium]
MRKTYSDKAIDHFLNPRNLGQIESPDGFGRVTGPCGDTIEIYLRVNGGKITNATFQTDGCGPSIVSGSMATELIKGKTIVEAQNISKDDILDALGGLPKESQHCSLLAANTVKEAVRDYLALSHEPWKRLYKIR